MSSDKGRGRSESAPPEKGRRGKSAPAKITRPVTGAEVVSRERLFKLMDRARPMVWITGPAGSGKTTLATSHVESRGPACLWYQCDPGDGDPATFFHYLGLAASRAAPRYKRPLPHLTPEYMLGLPVFTRRFFEMLFSRLKPPFVIVLDNYQDIPRDSMLHDLICIGLETLPAGGRAVLLSRSGPPGQYARLRANSRMDVIGWDELALNPGETGEIIRRRLGGKPGGGLARALHERAGGWTAGVVLMLDSLKVRKKDALPEAGGTQVEIFEYFAAEVLDRMDEGTREFLLKSAISPYITPGLAGALTGRKDAVGLLDELLRRNYFIIKRPGGIYQYHPLFREFLLRKAAQSIAPASLNRLKRNAAGLLEQAGHIDSAASLYIEGGDWNGLERIVTGHGAMLLAQGRHMSIEAWIRGVPDGVLSRRPWLMYWLGLPLAFMNPKEGLSYLERAFLGFRRKKDATGAWLSWACIIEMQGLFLDSPKLATKWIPMLDGLLAEFGGFPSREVETRVSTSLFMALEHSIREHPDFDKWKDRALKLSADFGDPALRMQVLVNYANDRLQRGLFNEGAMALDECAALAAGDAMPILKIQYKWIRIVVNILTGEYDACMKLVDDAMRFSASTGVHVWDFFTLGHGVLCAINAGDLDAAKSLLGRLDSMRQIGNITNVNKCLRFFLQIELAIVEGDYERADSYIQPYLEALQKTAYLAGKVIGCYQLAVVANALGRRNEARGYLDRCLKLYTESRFWYFDVSYHLTSALIAFDGGDEALGLKEMKKGFSIAKKRGYRALYLWIPSMMSRLCCRAIEEGIEVEYVKRLIKTHNLKPPERPFDCEAWPWHVKVYSLGRFSVLKDDRPITFTGKAQKKPMELLKALVALGGRDVPEAKLLDILWPDADGGRAHASFTTTLKRLRKLLGCDDAVRLSDGCLSLNPECCWVDVRAFDMLTADAGKALEKSRFKEATDLIGKALELYHGTFFRTENMHWCIAPRERLRSRFVRFATEQGRAYESFNDHKRAADSYNRAIEVEPLAEELYQAKMLCLKRLGRKAEAVAAYRRLKMVLSAALKVEPSERSRVIYEGL